MKREAFLLYLDGNRNINLGPEAVKKLQRQRLSELTVITRANSAFYQQLYKGLPEWIDEPSMLPITSKTMLMERFNDWVTDSEVTIEKVRKFIEDLNLIAENFLDKYKAAITSGSTGTRGIFLLDERAMSVSFAMDIRLYRQTLTASDVAKILARGGQIAAIVETDCHSLSIILATLYRKSGKLLGRAIHILPVTMPLPELVSSLNKLSPAVLIGYAGTLAVLVGEQEAERLHIQPVLIEAVAEGLAETDYTRMAEVFNAKINNKYAATECPFIGHSCRYGWIHINADWVIIEPVDEYFRPAPAGIPSHTVLITNLANKIQPIIRYDLGDRILVKAEPCLCGNTMPAIRIYGRTADMLVFPGKGGKEVVIPALVFDMDKILGIELSQIVQTTETSLSIRLKPAQEVNPESVWTTAESNIKRLLKENGLEHITVERSKELPVQSEGGKYLAVIPLYKSRVKLKNY